MRGTYRYLRFICKIIYLRSDLMDERAWRPQVAMLSHPSNLMLNLVDADVIEVCTLNGVLEGLLEDGAATFNFPDHIEMEYDIGIDKDVVNILPVVFELVVIDGWISGNVKEELRFRKGRMRSHGLASTYAHIHKVLGGMTTTVLRGRCSRIQSMAWRCSCA